MLTINCSFVGDLQEPFRWISDLTVMEAFESGVLDMPDFYFTGDDYRYRFDSEAKHEFLNLLRGFFNSGVKYNGRALRWDTLIEQKTIELCRYLTDRAGSLDFSEPSLDLHMMDDRKLRRQVLGLAQSEAVRRGIRKSTLHYLKRRARNYRAFHVCRKVREKLEMC